MRYYVKTSKRPRHTKSINAAKKQLYYAVLDAGLIEDVNVQNLLDTFGDAKFTKQAQSLTIGGKLIVWYMVDEKTFYLKRKLRKNAD